jgi:hypothetical protein
VGSSKGKKGPEARAMCVERVSTLALSSHPALLLAAGSYWSGEGRGYLWVVSPKHV